RAEGEDGATVTVTAQSDEGDAAFDAAGDDGYDDGYGTSALEDAADGDDAGYGSAQETDESESNDGYAATSAFDDSDSSGDYGDTPIDRTYNSNFPVDASPPSMLEDEDYVESSTEPVASAHAFDYSA